MVQVKASHDDTAVLCLKGGRSLYQSQSHPNRSENEKIFRRGKVAAVKIVLKRLCSLSVEGLIMNPIIWVSFRRTIGHCFSIPSILQPWKQEPKRKSRKPCCKILFMIIIVSSVLGVQTCQKFNVLDLITWLNNNVFTEDTKTWGFYLNDRSPVLSYHGNHRHHSGRTHDIVGNSHVTPAGNSILKLPVEAIVPTGS